MTQHSAVTMFVERLSSHTSLTAEERSAVVALTWRTKRVPVRHDLARIGETESECYVVSQGLIGRFQQSADGKRQILSIHVPGEMVNLQALMVPDTITGMNALTVSSVEHVPIESLRELSNRFPSLGQAFCRDIVINAQILEQSLVSVGRRSARARIAHFLCEVGERFRRTNGTDCCAYRLSMSQEQIGDTLGLTSVHVNRMMSELRAENLVMTAGQEITIVDPARLAWIGEFDPSYLFVDKDLLITPLTQISASGETFR